jgi:esterase/lipase
MSMFGGGGGQATSLQLGLRHQPSGLNTFFSGSQFTFPEYIQHSREMIAQARTGVTAGNLDKIVDGNAPFELKPAEGSPAGKEKTYRRGILLTHGLSDSPYFMRHLGAFFQEQGFRVMAILLPGHGTRPGDLLDVRWQEWLKAVEYGVGQLALEVDEVYLGGYSAGGALSVYQSLGDQRIRGLFLFAPALQISSKAAFANFHKVYSRLIPAAQWLDIRPDADIYKYESFPKNAAAQMYALTRAVNARMAKGTLNIPVFAVASQDDVTVNTSATVEFMAQTQHPVSKLVYYFSKPDSTPAAILKEKIELVPGSFPAKKIISSAHTAIVLPDVDAHYGEQGEYFNAIHYYPREMDKYTVCSRPAEAVWQGEITAENLKVGAVRRLMYNPNFAALKSAMRQFINSLPA